MQRLLSESDLADGVSGAATERATIDPICPPYPADMQIPHRNQSDCMSRRLTWYAVACRDSDAAPNCPDASILCDV
jgi:hypothetical protein